MDGFNIVIISGNLTSEPRIETSQQYNRKRARLTLAVNKSGRELGNGERTADRVEYVPVVLTGGACTLAERHLHKGSYVTIKGELRVDSWQDAQTQAWKNLTYVHSNDIRPEWSHQGEAKAEAQPEQVVIRNVADVAEAIKRNPIASKLINHTGAEEEELPF